MKLTKGKINKLYKKKKQSLKKIKNKKKLKHFTFRKNKKINLYKKTLKNFKGGADFDFNEIQFVDKNYDSINPVDTNYNINDEGVLTILGRNKSISGSDNSSGSDNNSSYSNDSTIEQGISFTNSRENDLNSEIGAAVIDIVRKIIAESNSQQDPDVALQNVLNIIPTENQVVTPSAPDFSEGDLSPRN